MSVLHKNEIILIKSFYLAKVEDHLPLTPTAGTLICKNMNVKQEMFCEKGHQIRLSEL